MSFYLDSNIEVIINDSLHADQRNKTTWQLLLFPILNCLCGVWLVGFLIGHKIPRELLGTCSKTCITLVPLASHLPMSLRTRISPQVSVCLSDCFITLFKVSGTNTKNPLES